MDNVVKKHLFEFLKQHRPINGTRLIEDDLEIAFVKGYNTAAKRLKDQNRSADTQRLCYLVDNGINVMQYEPGYYGLESARRVDSFGYHLKCRSPREAIDAGMREGFK